MYLDVRWNWGRTKLVLIPVLFRGIQMTLTKYLEQVYMLFCQIRLASISAQIAVCDVTAPIMGMVYKHNQNKRKSQRIT